MRMLIRRAQTFSAHMHIDLRRRQGSMSQQLLYDADIGAVVQQVGRKAVTKDVRMDPDVHAAAVTLPAHDILYAPCGQPLSPLIDKEEIRHWACWLRDYVQLELARWSAVSANRKKKRSEDYYLKQCRAFIDRYYNRNPTLGDLAELLRVNPNYLGEIIRKHGGRNFRRMLLERRMREAEIFLKLHGGTMKIGEIAQLCGFSDSNYFSCCFRREYGITPGEFRSRGGNTGKAFQDTEPE